ncbi:MAG TPA: peptidylprolyl isomerase [Macromonas sp.]|nr:peptidylprolyl isomerase [Macromonas sp.]
MKHVLTAVALATTLTAPAWAQNLAIVNGKPVPMSRVTALTEQIQRSGRPVNEQIKDMIKEEVIAREIFMQEAEKRGLKTSASYRNQMELAQQTILINELRADFQKKNPVTDAEIKTEYDRFVAMNAGKEYHARHILVDSEEEAKALIEQIKKGGSFEELAKDKSKDTGSGANGGDLDWSTASTFVPEFSGAMTKLDKGQMTETPVKSEYGWHIIRVDDTREANLPPLEQVKAQISQQMTQQKLAKFQDELRAKAKVK